MTGKPIFMSGCRSWYVKFLLKIELKCVLIKTKARLNFKIVLGTLHTYPGRFSLKTEHSRVKLELMLCKLNMSDRHCLGWNGGAASPLPWISKFVFSRGFSGVWVF